MLGQHLQTACFISHDGLIQLFKSSKTKTCITSTAKPTDE